MSELRFSTRYCGQADYNDAQEYEKGDLRHWNPPQSIKYYLTLQWKGEYRIHMLRETITKLSLWWCNLKRGEEVIKIK